MAFWCLLWMNGRRKVPLGFIDGKMGMGRMEMTNDETCELRHSSFQARRHSVGLLRGSGAYRLGDGFDAERLRGFCGVHAAFGWLLAKLVVVFGLLFHAGEFEF